MCRCTLSYERCAPDDGSTCQSSESSRSHLLQAPGFLASLECRTLKPRIHDACTTPRIVTPWIPLLPQTSALHSTLTSFYLDSCLYDTARIVFRCLAMPAPRDSQSWSRKLPCDLLLSKLSSFSLASTNESQWALSCIQRN